MRKSSNYAKELEFAKSLAVEAGKIMLQYFRAEDIGHSWKKDTTPLTIADTKINSLVIDQVKKYYPEYGVIGEEESYKPDREMVWVVDPIDGTIPYSLGIPTSTFCLALVDRTNGQPKVAVVFDPYFDHNHLYSAVINEGAFLNNIPIKSSAVETLENSYIAINRISTIKDRAGNAISIKPALIADVLVKKGVKNLSFQSYAYEAVKVASGELMIAAITSGAPWDSAATSLIVVESGGVAVDYNGQPRRYDEFATGGIVAANQAVLDELLRDITESGI